MNLEYEAIRKAAMAWVRRAGALARERFGHAVASRKADRSWVTDVDHEVQAALLSAIAERFPEDAVISEETQRDPARHADVASARRVWVVDPIDGTRNYARAFPTFTISLGLMEQGRPVVGIVYDPMAEQMYTASAGGGAWRGEVAVRAADGPLSGGIILALPSSRRGSLPPVVHGWIDRMVTRNLGSTALHLALLGAGALDAVFCDECRLWDVAAGFLIAEEAGASIVSLDNRAYFPLDLAAYDNDLMPFLAAGRSGLDALMSEYRAAARHR